VPQGPRAGARCCRARARAWAKGQGPGPGPGPGPGARSQGQSAAGPSAQVGVAEQTRRTWCRAACRAAAMHSSRQVHKKLVGGHPLTHIPPCYVRPHSPPQAHAPRRITGTGVLWSCYPLTVWSGRCVPDVAHIHTVRCLSGSAKAAPEPAKWPSGPGQGPLGPLRAGGSKEPSGPLRGHAGRRPRGHMGSIWASRGRYWRP
jgi:hypothetical protein